MKHKIFIIICCVFASIYSLKGNNEFQKTREKSNETIPITIGEKLTVQSSILKEKRLIQVSLPADYHQNANEYPFYT